MKKQFLALTLLLCVLFTACGTETLPDLWQDASVTENTTFGTGASTVTVDVVAGEKTVTLTIKTDKETLGAAMLEYKLLEGDEGPYGLYIKKVIGITADYDVDQSYWAFTKNGEAMLTGVDGETIADGNHYELTYTK